MVGKNNNERIVNRQKDGCQDDYQNHIPVGVQMKIFTNKFI